MRKPKNLTDLAEIIRNVPTRSNSKMSFDMLYDFESSDSTEHSCGSACCIGGWVHYLNEETRSMELENAVQTLQPEISLEEFEKLCWPDMDDTDIDGEGYYATPEQGARAIEILRDTGKCDWWRAIQEGRLIEDENKGDNK